MILRRFMKHVTDQNWFAVGLDVIVVIVGIFLGLQVQAFYEEQADQVREMDYLVRIHDDLEQNVKVLENSIRMLDFFQEKGDFLSQVLENPDLVTENPTEFILAAETSGYVSPPNISVSTYNALNLNGDRLIFRDEELLYALTDYYNEIAASPLRAGAPTELLMMNFEYVAGILTYDQVKEINIKGPLYADYSYSVEEASAAYERMIAQPEFIDFLPRSAASHGFRYRVYVNWLDQAKNLRDKVKQKLDKE